MSNNPLLIAMTGASGARYGLRLIEVLLIGGQSVDLLISDPARVVLKQECDLSLVGEGDSVVEGVMGYFNRGGSPFFASQKKTNLRHFGLKDWMAPMASGSGGRRDMVICPCSMGTLARIRHGLSESLIERAADVMIKEGGRFVVVPRETPLSPIHLENMLALANLGVTILPASPGFYSGSQTVDGLVDFVVARILNRLGIAHSLLAGWPKNAK
ncbi:MAG: UbiX family flavin prenyltransferase [Magnetococcales bacterium]|nr:UbiX family flavin prenyltransferase [Magnetococcales bacterium]